MNAKLLSLYATTPIHAGVGSDGLSVIDLPIQREAHSGWPCIFGSAVKGAMRAWFRRQGADKEEEVRIFGPENEEASAHAGSLALSDARLLLFPIRSLTGFYKWIVCPALLDRLARDCQRAGMTDIPSPETWKVSQDKGLSAAGGAIFLEVYRLDTNALSADSPLFGWLARFGVDEDVLRERLVIVDDDLFSYLVQQSTPVHAHNRLDNETKTVATGALWYEETLPAETVLYVIAQPFASRKGKDDTSAEGIWQQFAEKVVGQFVQFGGNETVGMGFCHVKEVQA